MSKIEKKTSQDTKKKITATPKISLDNEVLKVMNDHYSSYLNEEVIGRECFSAPDLDSHICNITAKGDGGKRCTRCGNVVGRPCEVTCDVHHFCLSAYSVRLGLSVTKKRSGAAAITYNLRHYDYKNLYKEVMKRHELLQVEEAEEEHGLQEVEDSSKNDPGEIPDGTLMTYSDAAVLLKCSHTNIVAHIERKFLNKVMRGARSYVRRDEVEALQKKLEELK